MSRENNEGTWSMTVHKTRQEHLSEVTKIHTVDGSTVTVSGNFIAELSERSQITSLQGFNNMMLVNLENVTYMEVVRDDD